MTSGREGERERERAVNRAKFVDNAARVATP